MSKPTLAELEAFTAIATHRSFRKAADALGVSRSSLSYMMTALERSLGLRLLHRTTRSVSTTEAGERLLGKLGPIVRGLNDALDDLADDRGRPAGMLRINVNDVAAKLLLASAIPTFLDRYPDMELDLVSDGRLIDIIEAGFDAGVRLTEAVPQDMIAVALGGAARFVAVASPAYLAGRTLPLVPDDLHGHRCIRFRLPSGKRYRWDFERHGHEVAIDVPGALTLDDPGLMVEAALNGLGIVYVFERQVINQLTDGTLLSVLGDWCPPLPGLCLYYSGHRHVPAGLRAFIEVIKETVR